MRHHVRNTGQVEPAPTIASGDDVGAGGQRGGHQLRRTSDQRLRRAQRGTIHIELHRSSCRRREGGRQGQRVACGDRVGRGGQGKRSCNAVEGKSRGDRAVRRHRHQATACPTACAGPTGEGRATVGHSRQGDDRVVSEVCRTGDATSNADR